MGHSSIDIVGNLEEIIPFTGIYSFDPEANTHYWAYYAIDKKLLDLSNEMGLNISALKERELKPKENLKGKKAVQQMIQKRAKVTRFPHSVDLKNIHQLRKKRMLRHLKKMSLQMGKGSAQCKFTK